MHDKIPNYIKKILTAFSAASYEAYIVGGAVRDLLLGIEPGDFDITTSATPEETMAVCRKSGWHTVDKLGNNFGCVVAVVDKVPVEITTFRSEVYGSDAHKPDKINFCRSLREDLSRRDFTVNAMAMDLHGKIYDYFDGQQDLKNKILRTVGHAKTRYQEDALRMLRACRFVGQLNFNYVQEDDLLPAFGQSDTPYYLPVNFQFPVDRCSGLSLERVKNELDKMLLTQNAGKSIMLLLATGLNDCCCRKKSNGSYTEIAILPELTHLAGLKQNPRFHCYDTLEHTLAALENSPQDLATRWALLLHDIAKGLPGIRCLNKEGQPSDYGHEAKSALMADEILRRLHYPEKFVREVVWLVAQHMRFAPMLITGEKTLMHWVRTEGKKGVFRTTAEMTEAYKKLVAVFLADMGATCAKNNSELMYQGRLLGTQVIKLSKSFPIHTSDLAVTGKDLLAIAEKQNLKLLLTYLLKRVQDGNLPNQQKALLNAAQKYLHKQGDKNEII